MPEQLDIRNVFMVVSLFSTACYILKLCLYMVVGGDMEVDIDFDSLHEVDTSFTFFSIQSMLAFFMGFGWCGLTALNYLNVGSKLAIVVGVVTGLFFMWFSAWLMFNIKKLNKTIVVNVEELVGKTGKAYTTFEPNSDGRIEITLNNKLSILDATNLSEEKIDSFSEIKVEKVENKKIYITKL
ncbi:hypothetical protein IKU74_03725 [bacterium]|nr:hypothetical protein [bacterium]